jgi:hypothetical protein
MHIGRDGDVRARRERRVREPEDVCVRKTRAGRWVGGRWGFMCECIRRDGDVRVNEGVRAVYVERTKMR